MIDKIRELLKKYKNFTSDRTIDINERLAVSGMLAGIIAGFFGVLVLHQFYPKTIVCDVMWKIVVVTPVLMYLMNIKGKCPYTLTALIVGIYSCIGVNLMVASPIIPLSVGAVWVLFCAFYMVISYPKKYRLVSSIYGELCTTIAYIARIRREGKSVAAFFNDIEYLNSYVSIALSVAVLVVAVSKLKAIYSEENRIAIAEKERADKASSTSKVFLANMSHEIRTPLNAVIGYNDLIGQEDDLKKIKIYSKYIEKGSKNLLVLLNDILDYSAVESGKLRMEEEDYSVKELLRACRDQILPVLKEKNLRYIEDISDSVPEYLHGDSVRLRQCIGNLLTNAVTFTNEGYIKINVGAKWSEADGEYILYVSVADTGVGIDRKNIGKIFERYTKFESEYHNGAGLGLPITQYLVNEMGGELKAESEKGRGSHFHFYVKQKKAEYVEETLKRIESRKKEVFYALAVDDQNINTLLISKFCGQLKNIKLKCDTCSSGIQALEMCKQKKYDIIYLDHMMPKMDGLECYEKLREDTEGKNLETPVVMITANSQIGDRDMYLNTYHFNDYIPKPLGFQAFMGVTEDLLIPHGKS